MAWKIEGQYFENCSCDVPCPCTVSLDLGADRDRCNAFLVFQVESGEVDGVDVSGLTVAAMVDTPKVMSEGNWRLGVLIDDRASDEQAEKLGAVFGGQLGGPDGGARTAGRRAARHGARADGGLARERHPPDQGRRRRRGGGAGDRFPSARRTASRRDWSGSSIRPARTSRSPGRPSRRSAPSGSTSRSRAGPPSPTRSPGRPRLGGSAGSQRRARRRLGSSAPSSACSACCSHSRSSAWLVTDDRMGGMESTPGMELGGLGFYVTVWVVMMAAMMFPSVAPTVLMYDRLREGHRARGKGAARRRDRAVRRRLSPGVDRRRPGRLRPVRAGPGDRPGVPGLGRGGPLRHRRRDRGRGRVPGDAAQAGLPGQVPQPDDVPRRALAPRPGGRPRARVRGTAPGASAAAGR